MIEVGKTWYELKWLDQGRSEWQRSVCVYDSVGAGQEGVHS